MTGVETIGRIRFEHFQNGKGIKRIARELGIARDTVRKVLRSGATEFVYKREVQPQRRLGAWIETLTAIFEAEDKLPRRERRSTVRLFEELRGRGYDGAHDSVHRFVKSWRTERVRAPMHAFVPLRFDPGEAYQFDWSHEAIELHGLPLTVKLAQMRLSYSRMPFVRAYFRETQEMVFDAHDRAFAFYGGVCRRGIYDNMRTAVEAVFVGRARAYNRRFRTIRCSSGRRSSSTISVCTSTATRSAGKTRCVERPPRHDRVTVNESPVSAAPAKTKMAAQVRDSAPSPRRLIDGQGEIRVGGASSQISFASRSLHLLGLV